MEENISKYLYSPRNIIIAGISCAAAICLAILLQGLITVYFIPSSVLLDADVLFWRMSWSVFSFFTAAVLVFYTKRFFQKRFPEWFSISFSGSAILVLSTSIFLIVGRLIEDNFYQKSSILLSRESSFPVLPTVKELWLPLSVFLVCFAVTSLVSFAVTKLMNRAK